MTSIIKVDNLQNQCGANIISESANVITIGASGDTVTLAAGASQSGFGRSGSVNWDTTAKTTGFTAVSGNGYFVNTTAGAITVTLPATPAAGDIVAIADYANTSATNNITVGRNGSKIDGETANALIIVNGQVYTLVYVDATEGWKTVGQTFNQITLPAFVAATGGTITTCGDFKTHVFTGPGTFTVTNAGNSGGSTTVDYLVVAAGGGGGRDDFGSAPDPRLSGGGGAGGFRMSNSYSLPAPTTSPLASPTGIPVAVQAYPITVGAGGAGGTGPCGGGDGSPQTGAKGNDAIFSTITSAGGGGGEGHSPGPPAGGPAASVVAKTNGGSGGGGGFGHSNPAGATGTGNNPPTSPPQGNNGGLLTNPTYGGGGGGGAGAVGGNAPAGPGGIGSFVSPSFAVACAGTPGPAPGVRYFAGGGAGSSGPGASGTGGAGGGGSNADGTVNTGGGGSGRRQTNANAGGSGIVIIRYKFQ